MSKRPYKTQASSTRVASGTTNLLQSVPPTSSIGQGSYTSQLSYLTEPPSLDHISDSRLVVLLKNLSKRDGVTKAKALDDILGLISSSEDDTDNSVVEAWTKLYARLSIDISRRVRQLAHNVNGVISRSAGKRIARFMPKICPPWLAGLYDNDKIVSKAAQEALSTTFSTEEKLLGLRKAFQQSILQYCADVIQNETVDSLSDARTVSTDDAEAKYARTVATCICLLQDLIQTLPSKDRERHQSLYHDIFSSEKLWTFISDKDPFLVKSTCKVFQTYLVQVEDPATKDRICSTVLFYILSNPREASITYQSDTLLNLTSSNPQAWNVSFGKWHANIRSLKKFITDGSRGRPANFWSNIEKTIKLLPSEKLPYSVGPAFELLDIIKEGVEKNRQSLADTLSGWKIYVHIIQFISSLLTHENQVALTKVKGWPVIVDYVKPYSDKTMWQSKPLKALEVIAELLQLKAIHGVVKEEWPGITESLLISIRTLSPEQSKDYEKAQENIMFEGCRWSTVQRLLFLSEAGNIARIELDQALMNILQAAFDVLETRDGKPFGAAGIVNHIINHCCEQISESQLARGVIASFVEVTLPQLINSPSCKFLCFILYAQSGRDDFQGIWNSTLNKALEDVKLRQVSLPMLLDVSIMPSNFSLPKLHIYLQELISEKIKLAVEGDYDWSDLSFALNDISAIMSSENQCDLMRNLLESLQSDGKTESAITALKLVLDGQNHKFIRDFLAKPQGPNLLSNVLLVSESSTGDIAKSSSRIQQQLRELSKDRVTGTENLTIDVIQMNLKFATKLYPSIEKIIDLVKDLMEQTQVNDNSLAVRLMPSSRHWNELLDQYMRLLPSDDLKIVSDLGGTVSFLEREFYDLSCFDESVNTMDNQGLTKLIRITKYFAKLCHETKAFLMVEEATKVELYKAFVISMQLVNDDIALAGVHKLWDRNTEEAEAEVFELIESARALFDNWSQHGFSEEHAFVNIGNLDFFVNAKGLSPISFYNARAAATRTTELIAQHGTHNYQKFLPISSNEIYMQKQEDAFVEAALITGLGGSFLLYPPNVKTCQKMVSDMIGMRIKDKLSEKIALKILVALNLTFSREKAVAEAVAKQRLVFLVKQLVSWIDESLSKSIQRELLELLIIILPLVKDVYGSYWSDIIHFMLNIIKSHAIIPCKENNRERNLPLLHSSLRLYATLRLIRNNEDANADIIDLWKDLGCDTNNCLIMLLREPQDTPDDDYLPLKVVNELLCSQILMSNSLHLENISDFFITLNSLSKTVQQTSFKLLHKSIPLVQEQVSIDAAIENKKALLPKELTSLIKSSPSFLYEVSSSTATRRYLLSWILLFDHFEYSSLKVRTDYINNLKDDNYLTDLLDFTSEALGHSIGKPYDASKINVKDYSPDNNMSQLKDTQWLLSHIYYLSLVNVPSLVKNWWLNCNSRQTVLSIESWTMKYMAPHVIERALSVVINWVGSQNKESEDYLMVNVNSRVNEITASYPIDEQRTSIVIKFPDAFPLSQAIVEGVNRVAVEEKKWQAWLRSTQGVIAFQNNSIVDGLIAWRRNVVGALKGQTECAICYSIISADKQLPSKKCSTCKQFFHSSCLYKWFKSSNSSSCPLCRNPFNYG